MLEQLGDGWFRFAGGRRWRVRNPDYLCEVDDPGNIPSLYREHGIPDRLRRVRAFYAGRLNFGSLDRDGNALDILVANAMTESYGTVPSPLDRKDLERTLDAHPELPLDIRLDQLLRGIGAEKATRWLVRREPGYTTPIKTPGRVSVGAHHMLLATARGLPSQVRRGLPQDEGIREQIVRLAAESLYSAGLAVEYLNAAAAMHQGQLPMIAATYNAGRPRFTAANDWRLVQYGEHINRWIGYYNASRQSIGNSVPVNSRAVPTAPATRTTSPLPAGTPVAPGNNEQLSAHFTLAEFVRSDKARELGIDNQPTPALITNLRRLAAQMEQVRNLLGDREIKVNSAYRCLELNRALGSRDTSMHRHGLAIDFVCPNFGTPLAICREIAASTIPFDQVIHEYGSWVHFGLAVEGSSTRRQQLTIDREGTHAGLLPINS